LGFEIFCIERSPRSTFLGGVVAFPGGQLDPSDLSEAWGPGTLAGEVPPFPPGDRPLPAPARALAVAACRETLEEAAIVPVTGGPLEHAGALALQGELAAGVALADALRARRLGLDLGALCPFARWVTPEGEPRRYDAFFYLLRLPAGQEGASDRGETTQGFWVAPGELLARFAGGSLSLAPPTLRCVELLARCGSVEHAFALARRQPLAPICPAFVVGADPPALALPGDPAHPVPDRRVEGPSRFVLRDHRFVSEEASGEGTRPGGTTA
jgi:8-oxo-dGTP pyrophosphatase MutT (NUDIX family)